MLPQCRRRVLSGILAQCRPGLSSGLHHSAPCLAWGKFEKSRQRASPPPPVQERPEFAREELPHPIRAEAEAQEEKDDKDLGPSFRRFSPQRNRLDWKERTGTWIYESDYDPPNTRSGSKGGSRRASVIEERRRAAKNGPFDKEMSSLLGPPKSSDQGRMIGAGRRKSKFGAREFSTSACWHASVAAARRPFPEPLSEPFYGATPSGSAKPPFPGELPSLQKYIHPPRHPTNGKPSSTAANTSKRLESVPNMAFTSPPLLPGFVSALGSVLGPEAKPTPIQALSMHHLLGAAIGWRRALLASETGSGKSIAYMLPMLQGLKETELAAPRPPEPSTHSPEDQHPTRPRAIVLAPTHELTRQLTGFAKALIYEVKLSVHCASGAPVLGRRVDVLVGTPRKITELIRGRGWDRALEDEGKDSKALKKQGRTTGEPQIDLRDVEWIVVDEADVLFDPDFEVTTRRILEDTREARSFLTSPLQPQRPEGYPFNILLSSATVPHSLSTYLDKEIPGLKHLISPGTHRLPASTSVEYVQWTGGNRLADVERRLRKVFADHAAASGRKQRQAEQRQAEEGSQSKVLIFCNKSRKVEMLGEYLESKRIKNVALTGASASRNVGNSKHVEGFLRGPVRKRVEADKASERSFWGTSKPPILKQNDDVKVLVTTSLLSRGLDFSPAIRHVFIFDEPRNVVDFLHRAGRTGRAGMPGKVVIFGKSKGRGSARTDEVKRRVKGLLA